jgi:hypothetical protein
MGRRSRRGCKNGSPKTGRNCGRWRRNCANKRARAARPPDATTPTTGRAIEQLQTLRAIGVTGAWVLATEIFGWRRIQHLRQLGALVGLVPAPYSKVARRSPIKASPAPGTDGRRVIVQLAGSGSSINLRVPRPVVPAPLRRSGKRLRRIGDCRARAQIANRAVAVSGDRCPPRRLAAETDRELTTRRWRSPEGDPRAGASARRLDGFRGLSARAAVRLLDVHCLTSLALPTLDKAWLKS